MAKKKDKQISRSDSAQEFKSRLKEKEEALARLRVEMKAGKEKNTSAFKKARREIARIKTILREKELSL